MEDFPLNIWSVSELVLLLQCTIKVVHYNGCKTIKIYTL